MKLGPFEHGQAYCVVGPNNAVAFSDLRSHNCRHGGCAIIEWRQITWPDELCGQAGKRPCWLLAECVTEGVYPAPGPGKWVSLLSSGHCAKLPAAAGWGTGTFVS